MKTILEIVFVIIILIALASWILSFVLPLFFYFALIIVAIYFIAKIVKTLL